MRGMHDRRGGGWKHSLSLMGEGGREGAQAT